MRRSVIVLALLACTHDYGRRFSYEDTKKLTPGVSRRADAERIFGTPVSVTTSSDGKLVLGWSYTHVGAYGSSHGSRTLLVMFRPDGTYDQATEFASGSEANAILTR